MIYEINFSFEVELEIEDDVIMNRNKKLYFVSSSYQLYSSLCIILFILVSNIDIAIFYWKYIFLSNVAMKIEDVREIVFFSCAAICNVKILYIFSNINL